MRRHGQFMGKRPHIQQHKFEVKLQQYEIPTQYADWLEHLDPHLIVANLRSKMFELCEGPDSMTVSKPNECIHHNPDLVLAVIN